MQRHGVGGNKTLASVEVRELWSCRRVRGGEHTRKCTRTFPHNHWLGKQKGLNFVSSCNQQGLRKNPAVVLVGCTLGEARGIRLLLGKRQANNPETYSTETVI